MPRLFIALLLCTLCSPAVAAPPQINVGPLFDYLPPTSSNLLKRIRNAGEVTAYVRVEVTQMHFDADGVVTETPVATTALVRNSTDAAGVIASPSRLIIAGNGQQATRLLYRGTRDAERYFRLRFIPVSPSADEFSLSEEQASAAAALTSSVQVFTGFGTIMFIAPEHTHYDTRVEHPQVRNHGNATVVLENLRYCERTKPDACSAGIIAHIRPGQSYALDVADTHFSRYDLREGETRRSIDSRR